MPKKQNKRKYSLESLDEQNTALLAELVADPTTTDHLRVTIINRLLAASEGQSFFDTMFLEEISKGECPCCGHENHWLIPEDSLNEMGWVSFKQDSEVPERPTSKECPTFAEACQKKKTSI